jgi:hypothetical protein
MPAPDKTMEDVSKLVAEARAQIGELCAENAGCDQCDDVRKFSALADALESVAKERDALRETGAKVVEGFERRLFIRNTQGDGDSAWAIKFAPYLAALATLSK